MSKALSADLRERVLAAVAERASHREAAARFGVGVASVSRWRALAREQGDARPKALGGDRRSGQVEAQGALIRSSRRRRTPSRNCARHLRGTGMSSATRNDPAVLRPPPGRRSTVRPSSNPSRKPHGRGRLGRAAPRPVIIRRRRRN